MKRYARARRPLRVKPVRAAAFGLLVLLIIQIAFQPFAHRKEEWTDKAERVSMASVLKKAEWSKADYALVYQQTGLGRTALERLRQKNGYKKEDILDFQRSYFAKREIQCCRSSLFTRQDKITADRTQPVLLAPLEEGDIFLSFSSHSLGWRHGHAGMVVDSGERLCLEARMPGSCSCIKDADHWKSCSSFVILRLKDASLEERRKVAHYARKHLCGIPYSLASGLFKSTRGRNADDEELTAQCAYLIWYAYAQFGYDLDSDGGKLVTVWDLLESPQLEVVQSFGVSVRRQE